MPGIRKKTTKRKKVPVAAKKFARGRAKIKALEEKALNPKLDLVKDRGGNKHARVTYRSAMAAYKLASLSPILAKKVIQRYKQLESEGIKHIDNHSFYSSISVKTFIEQIEERAQEGPQRAAKRRISK